MTDDNIDWCTVAQVLDKELTRALDMLAEAHTVHVQLCPPCSVCNLLRSSGRR